MDRVAALHNDSHPLSGLDYDWLSQELHAAVFSARLVFSSLVALAMSLMTSTAVFLPIEEHRTAADRLQLMTGLSPERYWWITFFADMVHHLANCLVVIVPMLLPIYRNDKCQEITYAGRPAFYANISL